MDDQKLEQILNARDVPDAPSNLSHRIIEATRALPQDLKWYQKLRLPSFDFGGVMQPALAFGVVVLLVVGGFYVTQSQPQDDEVYLAFYVDDILGVEDYL